LKNTLVTDTSVLFAALDRTERLHGACSDLVASGATITLPAPVLTETTLLSRSRGTKNAVDALLESVLDGTLIVVDLESEDYARVRRLVATYADLALSFVDASVVAIAERLEETTIATLDRRHFSVVKPVHCEAFTLVP
jgi:predicted nucleic acid-binding protein